MKKEVFIIESRDYKGILNSDEIANTLEDGLIRARKILDESINYNYKINKHDIITFYSELINNNDEIIEGSYNEYFSISIEEYYKMDLEKKEKLFNICEYLFKF